MGKERYSRSVILGKTATILLRPHAIREAFALSEFTREIVGAALGVFAEIEVWACLSHSISLLFPIPTLLFKNAKSEKWGAVGGKV